MLQRLRRDFRNEGQVLGVGPAELVANAVSIAQTLGEARDAIAAGAALVFFEGGAAPQDRSLLAALEGRSSLLLGGSEAGIFLPGGYALGGLAVQGVTQGSLGLLCERSGEAKRLAEVLGRSAQGLSAAIVTGPAPLAETSLLDAAQWLLADDKTTTLCIALESPARAVLLAQSLALRSIGKRILVGLSVRDLRAEALLAALGIEVAIAGEDLAAVALQGRRAATPDFADVMSAVAAECYCTI